MSFKDDITQATYYKKLGDKAFTAGKFQKAAEHYSKGLQTYPFIAVIRNAKVSLRHVRTEELGNLLANIETLKKSYLETKSKNLIGKLDSSNIQDIKTEFFKYPYKNYPEIVSNIQTHIGTRLSGKRNSEFAHLFLYLGKYNPNDTQLKPLIQAILDSLPSNENIENAIFDFMELVKEYGNLIQDKLPEYSRQLTDILKFSTEFNERRFSAFALEVLGERDFNLVEPALPTLYENIRNPISILAGMQKKTTVFRTSFFEVRMGVETPNPHIWVLDASIDAISSLAKKYPSNLEHFVPVLIERLIDGNIYTKKKCVRALINCREAGIDISKYFPRRKIEDIARLLEE